MLNHTRCDFPKQADIITLVEYLEGLYFTKAISWICEVCGYDFYESSYHKNKEIDPCLAVLDEIAPHNYDDEVPLVKYPESILNEYVPNPHYNWLQEGVSHQVQTLFEVGFSVRDNCITIPIRDELGNLVGVKGRTVLAYEKLNMSKYWFPYPVPKSKILYGLNRSYPFIKEMGQCLVFESEKSVQKSFSIGFCNCVSIGGHEFSETQVLKLEKLGVDIVLALDNNVTAAEVRKEADKFLLKDRLYAIIQNKHKGIMGEKDSPADLSVENFIKLYNDDMYKIYK